MTVFSQAAGTIRRSGERLTIAMLVVLVFAAAIRPISSDDVWWQLSCGRAVVDGHISPQQFLLAGDSQGAADWLGGAPFFIVHWLAGFSGLMVLKVSAVSGLAVWCWSRGSHVPVSVRLLSTGCLVIVAAAACDPTPALWDLLGLLSAGAVLQELRETVSVRYLTAWCVLVCMWANLAPLSILALLPLTTKLLCREPADSTRLTRPAITLLFGGTLLGLCLTPRGPLGVWDSLRQLAPQFIESRAVLRETVWRPVWEGPADLALLAGSILGLLCLAGVMRGIKSRWPNALLLAVVLSLACWSTANFMVLSVWFARQAVDQWSGDDAEGLLSALPKRLVTRPAVLAVQGLCLLAPLAASLWGAGCLPGVRLGWGLNRRLEVRLLAESLGSFADSGTAHCTDVRAAGMLAWLRLPNVKPYLIPQRALLLGRLREEVLLNNELAAGWLKQHRRADGSAGGWWLRARARTTLLLLTSAERTTLIHSLEPTIWKPLSLDSPVIAYALAGHPQFMPRIREVQLQRDLVDRGPWTFQPEPAPGNDQLVDGIGWLTGWPDPEPILRQGAVLRAMNLPLAAMRVLRPILPARSRISGTARELAACQIEMAEREFLTVGRLSEFRRVVLEHLGASAAIQRLSSPGQTKSLPQVGAPWEKAVSLYLNGQPLDAAGLLVADDPAMMSARAMLVWEAGQPAEALEVWTALNQKYPDSVYGLASRHVLESGQY